MYLTLLVFCMSIVVVSCKESKEKEVESGESLAADKADMAMAAVYQCPMDCEDGKTYEKEGACPVCKMDLKKVEKETEVEDNEDTHDEHAGHDHD